MDCWTVDVIEAWRNYSSQSMSESKSSWTINNMNKPGLPKSQRTWLTLLHALLWISIYDVNNISLGTNNLTQIKFNGVPEIMASFQRMYNVMSIKTNLTQIGFNVPSIHFWYRFDMFDKYIHLVKYVLPQCLCSFMKITCPTLSFSFYYHNLKNISHLCLSKIRYYLDLLYWPVNCNDAP